MINHTGRLVLVNSVLSISPLYMYTAIKNAQLYFNIYTDTLIV